MITLYFHIIDFPLCQMSKNHTLSEWNHTGVNAVTIMGETQNEATTRK